MHRIFRTVNFKLVVLYAAIFSISVFILGLIVFYSIRTSIESQIKTQIELDATQLMGDYRDDGIDELRHDIHERIEANPANRLLYFIQSPDGRVIFDKISQLPPAGWHPLSTPDGKRIWLYSLELEDGYRFGVAADLERSLTLQRTVRNTFAAAFILSLIFGTAGGILVSRRFLARVDSFNRIAENIGRLGTLERRLPVDGSGDDFDQMAEIVNTMLERIQRLVDDIRQVTTNIAHDLRTPLGRIRQKLEGLGQYSNDENIHKQKLDEIVLLLDDTLQTFSALLHLAEIESGVAKSRFTEVDLNEILNSLLLTYRSVAEEQGLFLSYSPVSSARVNGDKRLLIQLFVNLIENAIRHAGSGAHIRAEIKSEAEEIRVSIEDNGVGIPRSEWENILKPFYRLEPSRNSPGSGLGLSFVAAIAKLHEARLTFEDNSPGLKVVLTFLKM